MCRNETPLYVMAASKRQLDGMPLSLQQSRCRMLRAVQGHDICFPGPALALVGDSLSSSCRVSSHWLVGDTLTVTMWIDIGACMYTRMYEIYVALLMVLNGDNHSHAMPSAC